MSTLYFIFNNDNILLEQHTDGSFTIPKSLSGVSESLIEGDVMDVTTLQDGTAIKAVHLRELPPDSEQFHQSTLRNSYYKLSYHDYLLAGKCHELIHWNQQTQYCGKCGGKMVLTEAHSKQCNRCHNEVWPQLTPAVIVLIRRNEEILLVHARNFKRNFYGLVAGFVETGETLEEAVHREVKEETGLTINNLQYFCSQAWPYPSGIMIGFTADYKSGELKLQKEELQDGQWFTKDNMPVLPEKLSIARRLIDVWLNEQEKKYTNPIILHT